MLPCAIPELLPLHFPFPRDESLVPGHELALGTGSMGSQVAFGSQSPLPAFMPTWLPTHQLSRAHMRPQVGRR